MNRKTASVSLLLVGISLLLGACDQLSAPAALTGKPAAAKPVSAVAVLDMAAVAKALGRDEVAKQQVQSAGRQLQQQLSDFSTGLQTQLREEQSKLGAQPSAEQRQQLQKLLVDAQRKVQQSQNLARQKAAQFQNQLAARFRDEIRPVAATIARKYGALSVIPTTTALWFEASIDITGEVIDAMRAKGAASGAPVLAPASGGASQGEPEPASQ
jgi:Skp family chaperone for outer membrane proteins